MTDDRVYDLPPTISKPAECDDAVSREDARSVIAKWVDGIRNTIGALEDIKALPRVTPKQRTGKWIMTSDYLTTAYGSVDYVKCSCCGEDSLEEGNYCPNCGAKMEGESE